MSDNKPRQFSFRRFMRILKQALSLALLVLELLKRLSDLWQ